MQLPIRRLRSSKPSVRYKGCQFVSLSAASCGANRLRTKTRLPAYTAKAVGVPACVCTPPGDTRPPTHRLRLRQPLAQAVVGGQVVPHSWRTRGGAGLGGNMTRNRRASRPPPAKRAPPAAAAAVALRGLRRLRRLRRLRWLWWLWQLRRSLSLFPADALHGRLASL